MMNVNYFIRLSFDKLETFDVNRSSLSTFVLVRNGLISALTEQKNQQHHYYYDDADDDDEMEDIILEEEDLYDEEEEYDEEIMKEIEQEQQEEAVEKGKVWLDSCFDQLEQDGQLQEEGENEEQVTVTKPDEDEDSDDDDEEEAMPLSPQQDDNDDFYSNSKPAHIYNQALVCFDIPFLSSLD